MQPGARHEMIDLPCGYIGNVSDTVYTRANVTELDFEAEMALGTAGGDNPMQDILARCLISVHDEHGAARIDDKTMLREEVIPSLLKGDWDWLLLRIVYLTLYKNEKYVFTVLCPNQSCKVQDTHSYDLAEVEFRAMPDRRRRHLPFTSRSGASHIFRHLRGVDGEALAYVAESDSDVLGKLLALHLHSIDDREFPDYIEDGGVFSARKLRDRVMALQESMPFVQEREAVRTMLQRAGGRPDLMVHSKCYHCGTRFQHRMPVDPTLLLPSANAGAEKHNPALAF